mmetsp:Transcript_20643/g.57299  ORF Transcript_20643/g.57299 Transcript_20643/m.57299 type:complete len:255 (-) Transcript_20643:322-1086(-)
MTGGAADVHGIVDDGLEGNPLLSAHHRGAGDDHLGVAVGDTASKGLRRESSKDNRVNGSDPRTGKHGNGELRQHGHVDCHSISFADSNRLEPVGQPADLLVDQVKCPHCILAGLITLPEEARVRALASLNVAIQGVKADVGAPPLEPVDIHGALVHVEVVVEVFLLERRLPVEFLGHGTPEALGVLNRQLVHLLVLLERGTVCVPLVDLIGLKALHSRRPAVMRKGGLKVLRGRDFDSPHGRQSGNDTVSGRPR